MAVGQYPHNCEKCRGLFLADYLLQVRIVHIGTKEGRAAAQMELDETLEKEHIDHSMEYRA